MRNTYTAETPVDIGGKRLRLQFDWRALGAIKTAFGSAEIGDLLRGDRPEALASMLAIGLARHHPEQWTVERILDASPPVVPVVDALTKAINAAYYGPDGPPSEVSQNPLRRIARWILGAIRSPKLSRSRGVAA